MYLPKLTVQLLSAYNTLKRITSIEEKEMPLVFWHGMGDSYNSPAMKRVFDVVNDYNSDIPVFSVFVDIDDSADQKASLFGDVDDQLEFVCGQLRNITDLDTGFNFIGFSQGGLFARAAIERCGLNVFTLVTFGSPHAGISDLPKCSESDWLCKKKNAILKGQVWRDSVQNHVVAAQYFRDPLDYNNYLDYSKFLADVNNEREDVNQTYIDNLSSLDKLVLIKFAKDETLVPLDSEWFYDQDKITGEAIPFNETDFYKEDLVGLKDLYDNDQIDFLSVDDVHMSFSDDFLREILDKYLTKKG